jgi:hypothetical protein
VNLPSGELALKGWGDYGVYDSKRRMFFGFLGDEQRRISR